MKFNVLTNLRAAAFFLLSVLGASAQAQIPVTDVALISSNTLGLTGVETAVTAAATSINTLANTNFQYLYQVIKGASVETAQAVNESGKLVANAGTRTAYDVEQAKLGYQYAVTNPCAVIASSSGMGDATRNGSASGSSFGRGGGGSTGTASTGITAGSGGASGDLVNAIAVAKGVIPAPGPEVTAQWAASGGCTAFAKGTRADACKAAQYATPQANSFANADVRAETIMDGPQGSTPTKKFTIDDDAGTDELTAVEAFMRNLGNSLELRSLGKAELGTDAGRRYLSLKDNYEGRMSMAEYPVRRQAGLTRPSADTKPVLERLNASQDAAFVTAYLNRTYSKWARKGISPDDLMNLEVERRYMNKDWMTRVYTMSPEEVQREALTTMAFQNTLLWRQAQETRVVGLLLASIATSTIRQESLPDLKAAHARAQQ